MPTPCQKCGDVHEPNRCSKHSSRSGKQCARRHGLIETRNGALVCPTHGGQAPQVKAAAARRRAETAVQKGIAGLIEQHQGDVTADPIAEMGRMLTVACMCERALFRLLESRGEFVETVNYGVAGVRREESIEMRMWREQCKTVMQFCKVAADTRLAERQAHLQTQQADIVVAVIVQTAVECGIPETRAREVAARNLLRIAESAPKGEALRP